jgi:hypothetical protein
MSAHDITDHFTPVACAPGQDWQADGAAGTGDNGDAGLEPERLAPRACDSGPGNAPLRRSLFRH